MISVESALQKVLALAAPLGAEEVPLSAAAGRVLAASARARRAQPPFDASAMDGYAVAAQDLAPGTRLRLIGEAAAGHAFAGGVASGEAVRIFTGAPVPEGADRVIIQEDVARAGAQITIRTDIDSATHIRPAGSDFGADFVLPAPRRLRAVDLALLAAMNVERVQVARRPVVALIATGDELVMPGETPREDQIVASNIFALQAMIEAEGGEARLLPIARDTADSLRGVFDLAAGADLVVTIGGASVGTHDLVGSVAGDLGMDRAFYKVAMRPGKPLMAGRLRGAAMLGLPGNPVSAIVCGMLFLLPALRAMQGLTDVAPQPRTARLGCDVDANGPRAHYMRARLRHTGAMPEITPVASQDSALLGMLAQAHALLLRPPDDAARTAGTQVPYLPLPASA